VVREVYSNAHDGTDNRRVNGAREANRQVQSFKWSPAGSHIAYVADQDTDNVYELYSSAPDGLDNQKVDGPLADGGFGFVASFLWSPDGTRIAYLADQDDALVWELYSSLPNGMDNHKVHGSLRRPTGEVGIYAWSPVPAP